MTDERLLPRITTPHQLRRLTGEQLKQLVAELRQEIVSVVSANGGHLASNLGVLELTVALHYVFDFSHDRLLWDVGHQCYAHKLLTGRGESFSRLRQEGGPSGFPSPTESEYDLFATGHAGTAISTAAGLAWADKLAARESKVVAVVGDASIVNGLSMEGINNVSMLNRQFLVILNDNSMAIDRTSGALAAFLDRIRVTTTYADIKQSTEHLLSHLPLGQELAEALRNLKEGLKRTIHGGQIFDALGLMYIGPVDGHDVGAMISLLRRLGNVNRPVLLHVHTQKGRGCAYAVEDPCRFHSPSAYTVENGKAVFEPKTQPTWTSVFGKALVELGRRNPKVVAITAAMPDGTGLTEFRSAFPDRYIDVGICESHAVAMAGGMAKAGLRPVVAVYSTFMQRAYDQVFQEVSLQRLPVVLCLDRSGLVGSDGAVHHGSMDIAFLRPLPNMVLMAPADAAEMSAALELAVTLDVASAIRYPRDEAPQDLPGDCPPFVLGKARVVREGADATVLCYGVMVELAMSAAKMLAAEEKMNVGVVNARFAKPLDGAMVARLVRSGAPVLIVEDHSAAGGFGSAVLEHCAANGLETASIRVLGLPDKYIEHASRHEQLTQAGLDATNIAATVKEMVLHHRPALGQEA